MFNTTQRREFYESAQQNQLTLNEVAHYLPESDAIKLLREHSSLIRKDPNDNHPYPLTRISEPTKVANKITKPIIVRKRSTPTVVTDRSVSGSSGRPSREETPGRSVTSNIATQANTGKKDKWHRKISAGLFANQRPTQQRAVTSVPATYGNATKPYIDFAFPFQFNPEDEKTRLFYAPKSTWRIKSPNLDQAEADKLPLFVYGSLMCPDIVSRITCMPFPKAIAKQMTPAILKSFVLLAVSFTDYPAITSVRTRAERDALDQVLNERVRTNEDGETIGIPFASLDPRSNSSTGATKKSLNHRDEFDIPSVQGMLLFGLNEENYAHLDKYEGRVYKRVEARVEIEIRDAMPQPLALLPPRPNTSMALKSPEGKDKDTTTSTAKKKIERRRSMLSGMNINNLRIDTERSNQPQRQPQPREQQPSPSTPSSLSSFPLPARFSTSTSSIQEDALPSPLDLDLIQSNQDRRDLNAAASLGVLEGRKVLIRANAYVFDLPLGNLVPPSVKGWNIEHVLSEAL